jgi:hypothetical protein
MGKHIMTMVLPLLLMERVIQTGLAAMLRDSETGLTEMVSILFKGMVL